LLKILVESLLLLSLQKDLVFSQHFKQIIHRSDDDVDDDVKEEATVYLQEATVATTAESTDNTE
jgi:hypothetical protein